MKKLHTEPDWKESRRHLNMHTLYWIESGSGTFYVDGKRRFTVESGMLLYLKPGISLDMETNIQNPLVITMVLVDVFELIADEGETDADINAKPYIPPMRGVWVREMDLPMMTLIGERSWRFIQSLFEQLLLCWIPGQSGLELMAKAHLYQLLHEMAQLKLYADSGEEKGPEHFRNMKADLEQHYGNNLLLQVIANKHGISASYARELFVRSLGVSPKGYLDRIRNEHAKKMLIYTLNSVKQIGGKCGFHDEYHFSKRFKQMNGLSPSAYRQQFGSDCNQLARRRSTSDDEISIR